MLSEASAGFETSAARREGAGAQRRAGACAAIMRAEHALCVTRLDVQKRKYSCHTVVCHLRHPVIAVVTDVMLRCAPYRASMRHRSGAYYNPASKRAAEEGRPPPGPRRHQHAPCPYLPPLVNVASSGERWQVCRPCAGKRATSSPERQVGNGNALAVKRQRTEVVARRGGAERSRNRVFLHRCAPVLRRGEKRRGVVLFCHEAKRASSATRSKRTMSGVK